MPPTLYTKTPLPRDISRRNEAVFIGGNLALDFVNSTSSHATVGASDHLMPGYGNLLDWCEQAGLVSEEEARRMQLVAGRNARDAAAIRSRATTLRTALHAAVLALINDTLVAPEHLETLSTEITAARNMQQLVATPDRVEWAWQNRTALDRPLAEIALHAESLLGSDRTALLRHCAAPACERVFLDTSRNGRRRYCTSEGCGTRERVRQFRQRQQAAPTPEQDKT